MESTQEAKPVLSWEKESFNYFRLESFSGKCVVILGDQDGLGEAMARELAMSEVRVAFVLRTRGDMERMRLKFAELIDKSVFLFFCDLSNRLEVKEVFSKIRQGLGDIHMLVNNLDSLYFVNAVFEVLPQFYRQRDGRLVNVQSSPALMRAWKEICSSLKRLGVSDYTVHVATVYIRSQGTQDAAAHEILKCLRRRQEDIVVDLQKKESSWGDFSGFGDVIPMPVRLH